MVGLLLNRALLRTILIIMSTRPMTASCPGGRFRDDAHRG